MELKNLIASGKSVAVYQEENLAIKVFDEDYPKAKVLEEAMIISSIEETDLLIPKLVEVSKIDNKWAISTEYVEGKTLHQLIKEDPDNIDKYIEQLLDIHLEIHKKKVPSLRKLKDKFRDLIEEIDIIDNNKKYDLLTRLDSAPKHTKLCHGDLNPWNIVVAGDKTYILDWDDASQGNASADIAQTYLALVLLYSQETADKYLDLFCKKTNTSRHYVEEWLPVVAAARVSANIPEERELLMKWLDVFDYQ